MEPTELPSGATCPESSTLTYDTFARAFFEDHCTRCHSADLGPLERGAAPVGVNFDSLDAIRSVGAEEIDEHAVKGGSDAEMPPGDPLPSEGERADLGEWLACGMQ